MYIPQQTNKKRNRQSQGSSQQFCINALRKEGDTYRVLALRWSQGGKENREEKENQRTLLL